MRLLLRLRFLLSFLLIKSMVFVVRRLKRGGSDKSTMSADTRHKTSFHTTFELRMVSRFLEKWSLFLELSSNSWIRSRLTRIFLYFIEIWLKLALVTWLKKLNTLSVLINFLKVVENYYYQNILSSISKIYFFSNIKKSLSKKSAQLEKSPRIGLKFKITFSIANFL